MDSERIMNDGYNYLYGERTDNCTTHQLRTSQTTMTRTPYIIHEENKNKLQILLPPSPSVHSAHPFNQFRSPRPLLPSKSYFPNPLFHSHPHSHPRCLPHHPHPLTPLLPSSQHAKG